jgi:catechol 2,3-dioxygenase-like lactoylglutathione lyase family enzyme
MKPDPAIVCPVARTLRVADLARAAAFYRDVLGFEVRESEGVLEARRGPACVRLEAGPPEPAMIFFETDDAAAMQAAIRTRGGAPGEIAPVNWVKMQIFELRDPDGHTVWFGQSYNTPDSVPARPMIQKLLPCLPVSDVAAAVAHYRGALGFRVNYQQDDLGVMDRDAVTLLLTKRRRPHQGPGAMYAYIENADALYAELKASGADLRGEPVSHPWGLRDFLVVDPDGNELRFGQPFE